MVEFNCNIPEEGGESIVKKRAYKYDRNIRKLRTLYLQSRSSNG